MPANQVRHPDE